MDNKHRGLLNKFEVTRADGSSTPGGKHHGCEHFVLDLAHDKYAGAALRAYADACAAEYPLLAADLRAKAAAVPPLPPPALPPLPPLTAPPPAQDAPCAATWWLVELFDPFGRSLGHYHTGGITHGGGGRSTQNPAAARRYDHRADAVAAAAKLGHLVGTWRASLHDACTARAR